MTAANPTAPLSARHREVLARALGRLKNTSLAKQLADLAGRPVGKALTSVPEPLKSRIDQAAEKAILRCLDVAVKSLKPTKKPPMTRVATMLAGISGGVGGLLGVAGLPLELPVTTILMLRAIANIARHQGEDLSKLEARLACIEVFALGAPSTENQTVALGYFASRALFARLSGKEMSLFVERGVTGASAPVLNRFVSEVAARFGIVVSERVAASAVPVVGALGGAAVNIVFMNYFQELARGHFAVRRLERLYGADIVQREYERLADGNVARGPSATHPSKSGAGEEASGEH
jgi:EcsC protein family